MTVKNVTFTRRSIPIPGNYRLPYRLAQIILILKLSCRSEKSTLIKFHCLSWIMKDADRKRNIINFLKNKDSNLIGFWGIDPAVNRVLAFAVADNFIELIKGKNYHLLAKGEKLYEYLLEIDELSTDIEFLKEIGKSLDETKVTNLSNNWI